MRDIDLAVCGIPNGFTKPYTGQVSQQAHAEARRVIAHLPESGEDDQVSQPPGRADQCRAPTFEVIQQLLQRRWIAEIAPGCLREIIIAQDSRTARVERLRRGEVGSILRLDIAAKSKLAR